MLIDLPNNCTCWSGELLQVERESSCYIDHTPLFSQAVVFHLFFPEGFLYLESWQYLIDQLSDVIRIIFFEGDSFIVYHLLPLGLHSLYALLFHLMDFCTLRSRLSSEMLENGVWLLAVVQSDLPFLTTDRWRVSQGALQQLHRHIFQQWELFFLWSQARKVFVCVLPDGRHSLPDVWCSVIYSRSIRRMLYSKMAKHALELTSCRRELNRG